MPRLRATVLRRSSGRRGGASAEARPFRRAPASSAPSAPAATPGRPGPRGAGGGPAGPGAGRPSAPAAPRAGSPRASRTPVPAAPGSRPAQRPPPRSGRASPRGDRAGPDARARRRSRACRCCEGGTRRASAAPLGAAVDLDDLRGDVAGGRRGQATGPAGHDGGGGGRVRRKPGGRRRSSLPNRATRRPASRAAVVTVPGAASPGPWRRTARTAGA